MRFCQYCGTAHVDQCSFCVRCGAPLPLAGYTFVSLTVPLPSAPFQGKAIASLVLGILSILGLCFLFSDELYLSGLSIPLGIIGLVLGVSARKDARRCHNNSGIALSGAILSLIGLVMAALIILVTVVSLLGIIAFIFMLISPYL